MKTEIAFLLLLAVKAISAQDSCTSLGCFAYDTSKTCQCNHLCEGYENCCSDYYGLCDTCEAFGGCVDYDNRQSCQCNSECSSYGNCCSDYETQCGDGSGSATTTASTTTTASSGSTTTTSTTTTTTAGGSGDSCAGRCGHSPDQTKSCQCNSVCSSYNDCCSDYSSICGGSSTDEFDFSAYASLLWSLDDNRIDDSYYTVDVRDSAKLSSSSNTADQATYKLFSHFNESVIYNTGTFVQFTKLCENYEPDQTVSEDRDSNQSDKDEQTAYINAIMNTTLMKTAASNLTDAGIVASTADFKAKLIEAFFDLYIRSSTTDSSSGFEHCFCGEWKSSTQVNGFHNWIQFYELEKQGNLNYYGHFGMSDPDHLGVQFYWNGRKKSLTSIMLGVSTEFELAIYLACFLENPGQQTSFTITDGSNSWPVKVQTYQQDTVHVGTAYFVS